jgi:hypothetical protein
MFNGGRQGPLCEPGLISSAALLAFLVALFAVSFASHARADDTGLQTIYRIKQRDGRVSYTNAVEQVPLEEREESRVDLSRVALNTELAGEINRQLDERHDALSQSSYCRELRQALGRGMLSQAWDEHATTFVAGCVALLLLIVLPGAVRRAGANMPLRALSVLVPLGLLVGLAMRGIGETRGSFALLQDKAKPCLKETFAKLDHVANPLKKKTALLDKLEAEALRAGALGMLQRGETPE